MNITDKIKAGNLDEARADIKAILDRKAFEALSEGCYTPGPKKSMIPAYLRGKDRRMTLKDVEKERTDSPTSKEGLKRLNDYLNYKTDTKD